MTNPTAQSCRLSATAASAATPPKNSVSHEMRRSVRAPLVATPALTCDSASIASTAIRRQTTKNLTHSAEKSEAAENNHQPGRCV